MRDKIATELTQPLLKKVFIQKKGYLLQVKAGEIKSWRHEEYNKGIKSRHGLYHMMIVHPFKDDHLD